MRMLEEEMPFTSKTPTYLTPEQRQELTQIPADLSDREIARYYTFTQKDLDLINQRRRHHNRLGFAVQLAVLRFPGRPLKDLAGVPSRVLAVIADQVQVPASAFFRYGDRDHTPYEHLDEIRRAYNFRECGWKEYVWLAHELLPLALESEHPLPLIEHMLELLRKEGILPPGFPHLERLTWIVLKAAERCLYRLLTSNLTLEHRTKLDGLLQWDSHFPALAAVSCSNTGCDGHDPVSSGCDSDAQTKYTATSNDLGGELRATVYLRYSVACLAAWAKVVFNQPMPSGHYGDAVVARNSDNRQQDCIEAGGNGKVWPGQTSCYSGMVGGGYSLTAYAAGLYWSPYAWKQVATTYSY